MRPLAVLALCLAGCSDPTSATRAARTEPEAPAPVTRARTDTTTPGTATPVDPGVTPAPTASPTLPLSDPSLSDGHVGRAPRRLNVRQLRASFERAIGTTWRQPRRILSADYPSGFYDDPNADMFELLGATLGRPDYNVFTNENLDPSAVFSKLVGDAARKACRDGVEADLGRARDRRLLLRHVDADATAATNETGVRQNLAYLVLRFWARQVPANDPAVTGLLDLFRAASTAPADMAASLPAGTPADGWRAVCVALATDPQFLTY